MVNKTTLDNGLRIITEHIPTVRSASVGIWVKSGSRDELPKQAGITHFIEHTLFKGTQKRSAYQIAREIEAAGGSLNAFTSAEHTCYYARVLDTEVDTALDVLSDMMINPQFPEEELEKEKFVVLEEMKMYRDSPPDFLFEEFSSSIFKDHPLGRPIIGFEETVNSFTRSDLIHYLNKRYWPENLIVTVAGNVDHQKIVDLVQSFLGDYTQEGEMQRVDEPLSDYQVQNLHLSKKIEQTHIVVGRRSLPVNHEERQILLLTDTLLSGGMSARLHQNIREKYGYCYSIFAFNQSYGDTGMFAVYSGTDKKHVDHLRDLIFVELDKLKEAKIDGKELKEAKNQLKGKLLLSLESTGNRMTRLGKNELYFDRFITQDELVEKIESVTTDQIHDFAQRFFIKEQFSEAILTPEEDE